jgi:hypothetical protein
MTRVDTAVTDVLVGFAQDRRSSEAFEPGDSKRAMPLMRLSPKRFCDDR